MPRAVRVMVSLPMLHTLLGFDRPGEPRIVHAAVRHARDAHPVLELLLEGDALPEVFTVDAGMPIKDGHIIARRSQSGARIAPLEGC